MADLTPKSTTLSAVPSNDDLISHLDRLLRRDDTELASFITRLERDLAVPDTRARLHCNVLQLDGNGSPRVSDLARWLGAQVVDYAIPRTEILAARAFDAKHNTTRRMVELATKARRLFTRISNTGEGGELLLYVLAQTQLGLPQLFCKMPLKTNAAMHVHGTDGIHAGVNPSTGSLVLYWCESKLYQTISSAASEAFTSLTPFVCRTGGALAPYDRDLQLMRDNLSLPDPTFENAVLRFLDRNDPQHNLVEFRGICLLGFDHACYTSLGMDKQATRLAEQARVSLNDWRDTVARHIAGRPQLPTIHLEVFILPFPSVDTFRKAFLQELDA